VLKHNIVKKSGGWRQAPQILNALASSTGTYWIKGLMDSRTGLDMAVKRKIPDHTGNRTLVVQPEASRSIDILSPASVIASS
jgi:hypothetical protein